MRVVIDLDTESAELREQPFDLLLPRIASHVAQLFVLVSGQDFVNDARELVGDGDLGFVL